MKRRAYIPLSERLAAAYAMLLPAETRDALRAAQAPAGDVIALFEQHHNILHFHGGPDRWFNLTPMPKAEHRERTRKIDRKIIAKTKRMDKKNWDFVGTLMKPCRS